MKPDPVDLIRYRTVRFCEAVVTLAALIALALIVVEVWGKA